MQIIPAFSFKSNGNVQICLFTFHTRENSKPKKIYLWIISSESFSYLKKKKKKIFYSSLQGLWEWGEGLKIYFISHLFTEPCSSRMKSRAQCPDKLRIFKSEVDKGASLKSHCFQASGYEDMQLEKIKIAECY